MDRKRGMMFALLLLLSMMTMMTMINATMTAQCVFDHLPRQLAVKMLIYMFSSRLQSKKAEKRQKKACQPPYSQALTTLQTCLRFLLLCENVRFFRKIRLERIKQIYGWAQPDLAGQITRCGKTFHCD